MITFKKLTLAVLVLINFNMFSQEIIKMQSKVISATVFSESAIVTREAKVEIPSTGEYQLVFTNLISEFSDQTVKISGKGTAKIKIVDVKTEERHTTEINNKLLKKEQEKIDSLKLQNQILDDKIAVLQSQKSFIESLKAESAKQQGNPKAETVKPSTQDWQNMVQFFSKNLNEVYNNLRDENIKKQKITEQIKTIEENIKMIRTGHDKNYKEIYVTIQSEQAGNLTLKASYLVYGASWNPVYDARVFTEDKNLELTYFGMVRQNTGEDWKNIDLSLSTAKPMFNFVFPVLNPLYLSLRSDYSNDKFVIRGIQNVVSAEKIQELPDQNAAVTLSRLPGLALNPTNKPVEEYRIEYDKSEIKAKDVFTKFEIPAKANIPSDNSPHKIHISTSPLDIAVEYKAVPKLVPGTFLSCKVANKNGLSLIAGQMSVYLGDDFVNKFDIANTSPGDTFNLSLGMDDGIKAERKRINKFTESKGLFGGKKSITYEYQIIVTNNKSKEQEIILNDQLPVSQNEDIKVELLSQKENELVMDKQKIITWKLKLKPGEKKILPLKYSISFPDNINIVDLE